MKIKSLLICASWMMVVFTMTIIYCLSEEDATKSAQTSGSVVRDVLETVMPEEEVTDEVVKKYQLPFRKIAHFAIFMLLGFCFENAYRFTINSKLYITFILSFVCVILYATLDEIHQGFINGRGPSFKDVMIDSSGGLFGVLLFATMTYVFNLFKLKKSVIDAISLS